MPRRLMLIGLVGLLAWSLGAAPRAVTVESLLAEMTDLAGMAEFPDPAYTCKQFSSYDRKSKSPTQDWFANDDTGKYLRVEERQERKEHVMMDAAGPGAIVRIWSANPKGTLRIYIDGSDTPALEAKMTDLLGGGFPGLPRPIAGERSKGWNLYFPIPYAKHCKVTSDEGGFYYHVNYRTYAAGTPVTSFTMEQLQRLSAQVTAVAQRLASPRGPRPGTMAMSFNGEVSPGAGVVHTTSGPKAITGLIIRLPEKDRETALRSLVMKISFDGNQTVEAPVGDFFGSGPGLNAYESLPLGMAKDGEMYSHWVMPFKEVASFEFKNLGSIPVSYSGQILTQPHTWTDRSMYFHAKWRADFDVPTRPMIDWNYMTAAGRGVFAGAAFNIDNPVRDWWGEGDEKIYVDGETFPSHFGTGTEDYFGYAWCWPGLFVHAYHNQTRCDGPGNYGRTSVNRWHILDRIPFTKDFKFDMELWHWKECRVNMSVISYWYAMPGGRDGFKPIAAADVVIRPVPEMPKPPRVAGAIEGEEMKVVSATGQAETQEWPGVSNGHQLWWKPGTQPGGEMLVTFKAPKAGKYRIFGRFLKAKDYGVVQLAFNGQKAGEPIDFYNPEVVPQKEMDLGVFDLKEGDNILKATIVGSNPQAVKSHMFGLDYVRLEEAAPKIALQLYSLRNQMKTDVAGTHALLPKWGIRYIEGGGTYGMSMEAYKELLAKNNLQMIGVGADFDQLKTNPQAIIANAKAFGARYATCFWIPHPQGQFSIRETQEAVEVFNRAGKILADAGITLCYHPHGYEFVPHGQGVLFDELMRNARHYAFNMDVFWVQMGGGDPLAVMKRHPDKFPLLHLKDRRKGTPGSTDGRGDVETNVVLGTGDIDIRGLIQQAKQSGTEYLVIEDESSRSVEQIPQSVEFIRKVLAE